MMQQTFLCLVAQKCTGWMGSEQGVNNCKLKLLLKGEYANKILMKIEIL